MIRVTRNDDIAFNVNEVRGKGDRYKITFYTVNSAVNIQKTDQDVTDGIITLNGSELMTIGEGVMNFRVDNIAPNADYNDGIFNSSFTRTTKYYIVSGVIIPDGEDTETVINLVSELQNTISTEITRSTNKDNAHDAALANVYTKAEIDDMLDDIDVVLPDNIVTDENYTHTDNNYTTTDKNKLAGIAAGAEVNVQSDWNVTSTSSDAYIKNKPNKVSDFTNDAGYLTTETDPTVPSWAKQSTKPSYTASEVGALPSSTVIPSKTSDLTNDSGFVTGSKIYVGTCTTAAATMPKVCTVETFPTDNQGKPLLGTTIAVKFTNTNTGTTNRGLNVNGTGSAAVWYNTGVTTTASYYGTANRYIQYFWDGTNWVFLSWGYDADTTYTNVALGQGYATQNNTAAATAITATLSSYALTANGIVSVKFKYDVPAGATLNINSKGAKAIYHKDAAITDGVIKAGDTATFIYNTYYRLISVDSWQNGGSGGSGDTYTKTEIDNKLTNLYTTAINVFDGIDSYIVVTGDYDDTNDCNSLRINDLYSGKSTLLPMTGDIAVKDGFDNKEIIVLTENNSILLTVGYNVIGSLMGVDSPVAVTVDFKNKNDKNTLAPVFYLYCANAIKSQVSSFVYPNDINIYWEDGEEPDVISELQNNNNLGIVLKFTRIEANGTFLGEVKRFIKRV